MCKNFEKRLCISKKFLIENIIENFREKLKIMLIILFATTTDFDIFLNVTWNTSSRSEFCSRLFFLFAHEHISEREISRIPFSILFQRMGARAPRRAAPRLARSLAGARISVNYCTCKVEGYRMTSAGAPLLHSITSFSAMIAQSHFLLLPRVRARSSNGLWSTILRRIVDGNIERNNDRELRVQLPRVNEHPGR